MNCCKAHKSTGCQSPTPKTVEEAAAAALKYEFPTSDTVPMEKLNLLRESAEIKECLKNPHVRDIARGILNDSDPTKAIAEAMVEPIFVELADACLKIVEPPDDQKPC